MGGSVPEQGPRKRKFCGICYEIRKPTMDVQNFDHSHHALKIRGLSSGVDVLSLKARSN